MIVLVCGGRNYSDRARVFRELDRLAAERGPFTRVVQGGASGADSLARDWTWERYGVQAIKTLHAHWDDLETPRW
jgi:hypothetical protein